MIADVDNKRRLRCHLQVNAIVIVNAFGVMPLARDVALRKLRPKSCGFRQLRRRDVIRMSIFPIRREEPLWFGLANDSGQLMSRVERCFETPIRQPKIASPSQIKNLRRSIGLRRADFWRAVRRGLAIG